MQKQAPTLARLLVMVGFALSCFGLLLFLWLAFGGATPLKPKGYRFDVPFAEATQLAEQADVRISGVPVGKVSRVEPNRKTGESIATIQLEERFAPIPNNTRAMLRQKTLLGETYIELTPGKPGPNAPMLPEGDSLKPAQVAETVELDEIFRTFDARTRTAFQTWMQQQARAIRGRGLDINDVLGNLDPFAEDTTKLLKILNSQEGAVRRVIGNTGEVFDAISERRGQLRGLITNANQVFTTTARRNRDIQELFRVFPTFNREATTTVNRLARFARDTDPLIDQLRPAARQLSPTLRDLGVLAPDLRALFRDLDPLIVASRRGLPALERFLDDLRPALGEFDPVLRQLNPILNFFGAYKDNVRAFFIGPPLSTQARANGVHYLRTMNPQNPENLAVYPRRIGSNRPNPYMLPRGFDLLDRPRGGAGPGLDAYETRHCNNGNPVPVETFAPSLAESVGALAGLNPQQTATEIGELRGQLLQYVFANAGREVPAPPCRQQPKFQTRNGALVTSGGEITQYPHVQEAPSSTARP